MGIEVGSAFVTLVPSLRGFSSKAKSELDRSGLGSSLSRGLTSEATRAGSRAGGLFSRSFNARARVGVGRGGGLFTGLVGSVRGYTAILGAAGAATVGFGLKTASSLEQAKVAFTTMLGSAKRAGTFVAGLTRFARKTPFDFPGVVSASQKLLAFGFTAKDTLPTLTSLGDAAAGLSLGTEGLDRLTTAVGQIQAKGKVQSDELLQLTEAGVPALKILANSFGVTTAAMQDMVTKGLVPADKAVPALLRGLEKGTDGIAGKTAKFGGLMRKQSRTLGGVLSNMRDTVSQGLAGAVKPLARVLERELPKTMKPLKRAFTTAGRDLAEFLHGLGVAGDRSKGTSTGFEQLGSAVRGIAHAFRATFGFISRNAKVFKPLALAILGAVAALKVFRVVMIGVNLVMDANPVSLVVLAIGALAAGLIYAYKKSETFRNIVKGVFHVVQRVVEIAVFGIIHYFKFMIDVWTTVVGAIVHGAAAAFGWVPGVGGKLKAASKAFDGFKADVDRTLTGIANDALHLGTDAGSNWIDGFNAGVHAAPAGLAGNLNPNVGIGGSATDAGKKAVNKAAEDASTAGATVGASLGDGLSSGVDSSASKVGKSVSDLTDKILGPLKDLLSKARGLAHSVAGAILGDTGFGAILGQTDAFGQTGFGSSVKGIISGFVNEKREVLRFRRELRALEKRGLSDAAIREIANEGLQQGGGIAETLMGATRKQLRKISNLRRGVHHGAAGIGSDIARDRFGGQIARELVRTQHAIDRASKNTELGPKTMRKLTGGLGKEAKRSKVYLDTSELDRHDGAVVAGLV